MTTLRSFEENNTRFVALVSAELNRQGIPIQDIDNQPDGTLLRTAVGDLWTGNLVTGLGDSSWEVYSSAASVTVDRMLGAHRAAGSNDRSMFDFDDPFIANQLRLCLRPYPHHHADSALGGLATFNYAPLVGDAAELLALRLDGSIAILPDACVADRYEELHQIAQDNMVDVPFDLDLIEDTQDRTRPVFRLTGPHGFVSSLARVVGDTLADYLEVDDLADATYLLFAPADNCLLAVIASTPISTQEYEELEKIAAIHEGHGGVRTALRANAGDLWRWERHWHAV